MPLQRHLTVDIDSRSVDFVRSTLIDDADAFGLAWFLSGQHLGSVSALLPFAPQPALNLDRRQLAINLSLKLLLPPASHLRLPSTVRRAPTVSRDAIPPTRAASLTCRLCASSNNCANLIDGRFHGLSCPHLKGLASSRHDIVNSIVADFLRRIFGRGNVEVEHTPFATATTTTSSSSNTNSPSIRFDIRLKVSDFTVFLIDTSVVNPACSAHTKGDINSVTAHTASDFMERLKRTKYHAALGHLGLTQDCFVPFVLDATGRLGSSATAFLNHTLKAHSTLDPKRYSTQLAFLTRRIRAAIAKYNATLLEKMAESTTDLWAPLRPPTATAASVATIAAHSPTPSSAIDSRQPSTTTAQLLHPDHDLEYIEEPVQHPQHPQHPTASPLAPPQTVAPRVLAQFLTQDSFLDGDIDAAVLSAQE